MFLVVVVQGCCNPRAAGRGAAPCSPPALQVILLILLSLCAVCYAAWIHSARSKMEKRDCLSVYEPVTTSYCFLWSLFTCACLCVCVCQAEHLGSVGSTALQHMWQKLAPVSGPHLHPHPCLIRWQGQLLPTADWVSMCFSCCWFLNASSEVLNLNLTHCHCITSRFI